MLNYPPTVRQVPMASSGVDSNFYREEEISSIRAIDDRERRPNDQGCGRGFPINTIP